MSCSDQLPYQGCKVALATMHKKESTIAPVFRELLKVEVLVPSNIDTDQLGTFTGEIERRGSMADVALRKARMGMAATGLHFGLASEGTYGPHPQMPFITAGIELLAFVDDQRGIVAIETLLDESPCSRHIVLRVGEDPKVFLDEICFPQQAVTVRPNQPLSQGSGITKGVQTIMALESAINIGCANSTDNRVIVETDMRAHMNPTRMAVLGELATRLAERLNTRCKECTSPGFGRIEPIEGLPCSFCGMATPLSRGYWKCCLSCKNRERTERTDGVTVAPQEICQRCNP